MGTVPYTGPGFYCVGEPAGGTNRWCQQITDETETTAYTLHGGPFQSESECVSAGCSADDGGGEGCNPCAGAADGGVVVCKGKKPVVIPAPMNPQGNYVWTWTAGGPGWETFANFAAAIADELDGGAMQGHMRTKKKPKAKRRPGGK